MTTFVVSYGNTVADDPKVVSFASRPAAVKGATREPAGRAAFTVENAADVPFGNVGMRDLFNALIDKGVDLPDMPARVERFSDRSAAIRRLLDLFGKVAVPAPTDAEEPVQPARTPATRGVRTTMPRTSSGEKKFSPATKKAQVLALLDGEHTDAEIMEGAGLPNERQVVAHCAVLKKTHNIGHERVGGDETTAGKLKALYPRGKSYDDFVGETVAEPEPAAAQ